MSSKTKTLQTNIEKDISKRYKNRKVNIQGAQINYWTLYKNKEVICDFGCKCDVQGCIFHVFIANNRYF